MTRRRLALLAMVIVVAGAADAQDSVVEQQRRLAEARARSSAAAARATALEARARQARDAADQARAREAAVAARIDRAEQDIAAAQARGAIVDRLLAQQRARLATYQEPLARLLAALQSLARRPAVAAVVQPGSLDDAVHVRAILGTALPAVRRQTVELRDDLARTRTLERDAALAQAALKRGRVALIRERTALAAIALAQRDRGGTLERRAIAEGDRAMALVEDASDIAADLNDAGAAAAVAAALRGYPGPPTTAATAERAPASYRLPVAGALVRGLGEVSSSGVRSRGLTFATAPDATIVAPAAGRVTLVRPFRRYGTIVIIDHGNGWTTLVTGLATSLRVRDEAVPAGAPLGRSGSIDPQVTVELRRHGRPMDIAALVA